MSSLQSVKDLLVEEIQDLYSAEKQLTKAIPRMAQGANEPALQQAFRAHLDETREQVLRLEKIASILGKKATGKKCVGMEGIIEEGGEALNQSGQEDILDLGIIGAGSRVEHYEISGYTTAISLAQQMAASDIVALLKTSLKEEQGAEQKLRKIAAKLLKTTPKRAAAAAAK